MIRTALKEQEFPEKFIFANNTWESSCDFYFLKSISAQTYEKACDMAIQIVNGEARRFQYLLDSERLTEYDKDAFKSLLLPDMKESVLCSSLRILSELLEKHHGQKVILLIDEYDVPLAKAFELGYYNSMTLLIRNLFENALKQMTV